MSAQSTNVKHMDKKYTMKFHIFSLALLIGSLGFSTMLIRAEDPLDDTVNYTQSTTKPRIIKDIVIEGNHQVSADAILNKVTYRKEAFFNSLYAGQTIRNIMDMGYFKNVEVQGEYVGDDGIIIYIIVHEKKPLQEITFAGNKQVTRKIIDKKTNIADIVAADPLDLDALGVSLKRLYKEKNYHNTQVSYEIKDQGEKAIAAFTIKEGKQTIVKRVRFVGNKTFSGKTLRSLIFTREDWLLGFMDRAGSYQPDAIEADQHTLEGFYQNYGFFKAKVPKVDVDIDPETNEAIVTFHIYEGDIYKISGVSIIGSDTIPEAEVLPLLPVQVGACYSREAVRQSMELLRTLWGEYGYIYVDVVPGIEPNDDEKTVKISFFIEPGDKVYVNRINITGNKKTRDKIIRRQMLLSEGELLTTQKIDESKRRIEGLGYFERDGVNWKLSRVTEEFADVELNVQEIKTGRIEGQVGFGGSPKDLQSPATSARIVGSFSDTNLLGLGIGINLNAAYSKQERELLFNITEPWLFDKPIYAAIDVAFKRSVYEEFRLTEDEIKEHLAQGSLSIGFLSKKLNATKFIMQLGAEGIHYNRPPMSKETVLDIAEQAEFNRILRNRFHEGAFGWLGCQALQDLRNHPNQPTSGYQWALQTKLGFPGWSSRLGFWKIDYDASWFTPLIGERSLILYLHGHFGIVGSFPHKTIPYRELYHIGGQASVRGFLFGQIGPTFKGVDSLGAKKALWFNAELIFPIAPDFSIKGAVFYDGGSGWDTPDANQIHPIRLKNNGFDYRHAIGFGIRMLRPTPLKVDWAFKLDKRRGESWGEVHLSMAHDF
jgi:outer membrane protein insertion porin family